MAKKYTCPKCSGSGYYSYLRDMDCMECSGSGYIEVETKESFSDKLGSPFFGVFSSSKKNKKSSSPKVKSDKKRGWESLSLFEKIVIITAIIYLISLFGG